ncbi:putative diguanylate cyclase YcdT domain protein, partial [Escherichia coli 95.1288]|jgi:putative SOS response-associated peptidase YedK
LRGV